MSHPSLSQLIVTAILATGRQFNIFSSKFRRGAEFGLGGLSYGDVCFTAYESALLLGGGRRVEEDQSHPTHTV